MSVDIEIKRGTNPRLISEVYKFELSLKRKDIYIFSF